MKLKTKFQDEDFELGEVADVNIAIMPDGRIKAQAEAKAGGYHTFFYDSLQKMYEEWEDVLEPKEYWSIDQFGNPINVSGLNSLQLEKLRRIGILFQTKEETGKAVEKLKAWKRLKEKGLRLNHWKEAQLRPNMSCVAITGNIKVDEEVRADLDLLFSEVKND